MPLARITTALTLTVAVLGCVLWLPTAAVVAVVLVAGALGAWEWAALAGVVAAGARIAYAALVALFALAVLAVAPWTAPALLLVGCAWWLLAAAWVVGYQLRDAPSPRRRGALLAVGLLALVPALVAIGGLAGESRPALLALFAIVWSADTLAYAGGRKWGRRRFVSRVSPGKTWEGFACGLIGTLLLAAAVNALVVGVAWPGAAGLVLATFLAAVLGDLLESLVKRLRGVKDSGTLLPGHGGVLDRIDSLLAAAPVFSLTMRTLGPL